MEVLEIDELQLIARRQEPRADFLGGVIDRHVLRFDIQRRRAGPVVGFAMI